MAASFQQGERFMKKFKVPLAVGSVLAITVMSLPVFAGTPSYTVVMLTPDGFKSSQAMGAANGQQAGEGYPEGAGFPHALLWSGSAASAVDLHPAEYTLSAAMGTSSEQGNCICPKFSR